jgi:DNA-binding beta-propeller fold protein YncE
VDGNGNVYIADSGNHRIQKFTSDGTYLTQWGTYGATGWNAFEFRCEVASPGQFNWPEDVAVDASGRIYVADTRNNRIQVFTSDGAYLTQWGGDCSGEPISGPIAVSVDGDGSVFVADFVNGRISVFGSQSTPTKTASWGYLKGLYR